MKKHEQKLQMSPKRNKFMYVCIYVFSSGNLEHFISRCLFRVKENQTFCSGTPKNACSELQIDVETDAGKDASGGKTIIDGKTLTVFSVFSFLELSMFVSK